MSIDANSVFGPDEPPLRRLTKVPNRMLGVQQNSLTDIVTQTDFTTAPSARHAEPGYTNQQNSTSPLATTAQLSSQTPSILRSPAARPLTTFVGAATTQLQRVLSDQVSPVRLAGHFAVVVIAAVVLLVSQMEMPAWNLTLPRAFPTAITSAGAMSATEAVTQVGQVLGGQSAEAQTLGGSSLQRAIVPFTIIPEEQKEGITTYVVASGDTVLGAGKPLGSQCAQFGVQWHQFPRHPGAQNQRAGNATICQGWPSQRTGSPNHRRSLD